MKVVICRRQHIHPLRKQRPNLWRHADCDYPACDIPLAPGDRFLLYTDGVTEPENAAGEPFGDHKLEQIVRDSRSNHAADLSAHLLAEVRSWQSTPLAQDDITLIVIDVV